MTGTSFDIRVSNQERNVAAKFQPDQLSSLARRVEIGDGQTVHDDNTLSGI